MVCRCGGPVMDKQPAQGALFFLQMAMSVCLLDARSTASVQTEITIIWIALNYFFITDMYAPQRMNPIDFGNHLTSGL